MKKTLFLIIVLLSMYNYTRAQELFTLRCIYQMEIQRDSLDAQSRIKEPTILLINDNKSFFQSYKKYMSDSAQYDNYKKNGNRFGDLTIAQKFYSNYDFKIIKSNGRIVTHDKIFINQYQYEEEENSLSWNLSNDTMSINGFFCQKAETTFGGRKWIAWFCPGIPVSDGPYKFCRLPGLIISIYDSRLYIKFSLLSMTNTLTSLDYLDWFSVEKVSKEDFYKMFLRFKQDPFSWVQQGPKAMKFGPSGGASYKRRLEIIEKKDNNWIELYKLE